MVIGQRQVDKKSNEITAFKPLLKPLNLEGKIVTADAMHTQVEHAICNVLSNDERLN
jgi:predicted transposase YbfD/YdcC